MGVYVPPGFALTDAELDAAVRRGGFAQLVTPAPGGLVITPLPLLYDAATRSLVGHVSRANEHWRQVCDGRSVAVFAGPDAYVSPSWYPTKAETGRAVPTWNYEVLHVHGRLVAHDDEAWLLAHVTALSDAHERGRPEPWAVTDAPPEFVAGQLRGIVGLQLQIARVEGKAKLSQNQAARNRDAVVEALGASSVAADRAVAERMGAACVSCSSAKPAAP